MGKRFKLFTFIGNLFTNKYKNLYYDKQLLADRLKNELDLSKENYQNLKEEFDSLTNKLRLAVDTLTLQQSTLEEMLNQTDPLYNQEKTLENTIGIQTTRSGKYQARVNVKQNNKVINLNVGTYDTIEEAYRARIDYILGLI